MTLKKTQSKSVTKKAVEKVARGREKSEYSSEFEDVFNVDYFAPQPRVTN